MKCRTCGKKKLPSSFYDNRLVCKECVRTRTNARYHKHKDAEVEGRYRRRLMAAYGITHDDYLRMYAEQEGRCAICSVPFENLPTRPHVDHDHETGRVRGLLCFNCNGGLGQFKDDPTLLVKAADYLAAL